MTTFTFRPLAIGTLALLMFAGNAPSQTASPILNTLEVQKLVASSEPAAHSKLSAHFAALADRYAADATRHASLQPAFAGNSKLAHLAASQAAHCRQLAARNQESASLLRELAAHHSNEAAGIPSSPPPGSDRFQGAARVPADAELAALAARAESAADHHSLAGYFSTIAEQYDRDAKDSATYVVSWRGLGKNPSAPAIAARWERLANQQRESAAEARAAAAMHKEQAAKAR
jgi:hypothetical protein